MIVGKCVRFRLPETQQDHEHLVRWRNDPRIKPYFYNDDPVSLESHMKWWAKVSADPTQRNFIIEIPDNNVAHDDYYALGGEIEYIPIGMGSLMNIDPVNRTGEYARFKIDPDYQGRGYATEAEILLMRYAFDSLNLNRVWLHAFPENPALMKLHANTGFVIEGRMRQHIWKNGEWRDVLVMGLLADEFRTRHAVEADEVQWTTAALKDIG